MFTVCDLIPFHDTLAEKICNEECQKIWPLGLVAFHFLG